MSRNLALLPILLLLSACTQDRAPAPLESLVRDHLPGIVTIVSYDPDKAMPKFGAGFLIAPDRVITCRHMFAGADRADVRTHAGQTIAVTGIIAENPTMDVAMVQLAQSAKDAQPLALADRPPQLGQRLLAVGAPLGLEWTVSDGIVSGIRDIPEAGPSLQHTAAVSGGSSGGPLLDMSGRVVAIQTSCITIGKDGYTHAGEALNFGVPAQVMAQLKPGAIKTLAAARKEIAAAWVPPVTRNIDKASLRPMTRDDFQGSLAFFEQVTRDNPTADAWFRLGLCYEKLNRNDDALKAYARATTISRDHATAWNNMGATYIRLQRYDEALPALKAAVAANPADVEALNSLAVAYICLKRYPEAIAPAAEAARLNPKHAYAQYHLGEACLKSDQRPRAVQQQKILVDLDAKLAQKLKGMIDSQATSRPTTRPA